MNADTLEMIADCCNPDAVAVLAKRYKGRTDAESDLCKLRNSGLSGRIIPITIGEYNG